MRSMVLSGQSLKPKCSHIEKPNHVSFGFIQVMHVSTKKFTQVYQLEMAFLERNKKSKSLSSALTFPVAYAIPDPSPSSWPLELSFDSVQASKVYQNSKHLARRPYSSKETDSVRGYQSCLQLLTTFLNNFQNMRVPVIVGVGRITERPKDSIAAASNGIQLSLAATKLALEDANASVKDIETIAFVRSLEDVWAMKTSGSKLYDNPSLTLGKALGIPHAKCILTEVGGNSPQMCVNECAERISRGDFKSVIITGAEALHTLKRALSSGYKLDPVQASDANAKILQWGETTGVAPEKIGSPGQFLEVSDLLHHLGEMPVAYSILDHAVRVRDGCSVSTRMAENAKMFEGLCKVATRKENQSHSWFPTFRSAEEIKTISPTNRMVAHPYSKFCCAVMDVNQAATVVMMSEDYALELGISREKFVYLHGCADSSDIAENIVYRPNLDRCIGMKVVGENCFASANLKPEEISFFDIYSCFPVAVRLACYEMNLPLDLVKDAERLSVVGGLAFHGGPGNNYSTHAITEMIKILRNNPGKFGLVTANGGILSKHSAGVYSTTPYSVTHPNSSTWKRPNCNASLAKMSPNSSRKVARNPNNCDGIVCSYSIRCDKNSKPTTVVIVGDVMSGKCVGSRFLAKSDEPNVVSFFLEEKAELHHTKVHLTTTSLRKDGELYITTFSLVDSSKL